MSAREHGGIALDPDPKRTRRNVAVATQEDVLLGALARFYEHGTRFRDFENVVRGHTCMSLRVLDWLVTNYAKKHNIVYVRETEGASHAFNVFLEYKSQLSAYSKRLFDPFCRRARITFGGVETTCGQLNFFRWALTYGVLDYAMAHHDQIEADMLNSIEHRSKKGAPQDRRRRELSKAAIKTCTTTMVRVRVVFS